MLNICCIHVLKITLEYLLIAEIILDGSICPYGQPAPLSLIPIYGIYALIDNNGGYFFIPLFRIVL